MTVINNKNDKSCHTRSLVIMEGGGEILGWLEKIILI